MRDQATDRSAGRDTVAMLYGHTMRHETAHGKAREEDAIKVDGVFFGERVEKGHQEARIVNIAAH